MANFLSSNAQIMTLEAVMQSELLSTTHSLDDRSLKVVAAIAREGTKCLWEDGWVFND